MDDKHWVIVALTSLGLASIFTPSMSPETVGIVQNICTGLCGIAVGKAMGGGK